MAKKRAIRRSKTNDFVGYMAAEEFLAIRVQLNLTQNQLGHLIGLNQGNPKRSIARYESGDSRIPGPLVVLMRALKAGYQPRHWNEIVDED